MLEALPSPRKIALPSERSYKMHLQGIWGALEREHSYRKELSAHRRAITAHLAIKKKGRNQRAW